MSKPVSYPIAYVYVHWTDESGVEYVTPYVSPHDGARQAADEAIRSIWGIDRERMPPTHRIRRVDVFENVQPRTFQIEKIVRPDFVLRERPD